MTRDALKRVQIRGAAQIGTNLLFGTLYVLAKTWRDVMRRDENQHATPGPITTRGSPSDWMTAPATARRPHLVSVI